MALTKPNQQLRRDLKEAAALLKWSGFDLFGVAKRLLVAGDDISADELMMIALSYQAMEDKLTDYADEVKAARIIRAAEQKT
ncbi:MULTISPECIES: hypothetical protein [unclassified Pseudomonas]|uniref:hypothetical protein n=1 Tax=unclassified Pseudomonas TaxID=196821 RepID=UPI001F2D9381|nr:MULTISPECIES: hypothetical protein [unclassified Pseudomonas]MCF5228563.1 hypothetical protein [Pseudomonas sp. PA-5-4H]MCF5236214.1 hypothetical protein [Pseudomonas sp. PA-5-4G]MCF5247422.1 hypothetical protein [Pseudomonas sp. PA-5-4B]MCF5253572.1 hypothetical protein [Pseudomonas sp. PA-5-4B]MCF5263288.1 hypothetical protein [Pseudomonas sp. PA-5-4A]